MDYALDFRRRSDGAKTGKRTLLLPRRSLLSPVKSVRPKLFGRCQHGLNGAGFPSLSPNMSTTATSRSTAVALHGDHSRRFACGQPVSFNALVDACIGNAWAVVGKGMSAEGEAPGYAPAAQWPRR